MTASSTTSGIPPPCILATARTRARSARATPRRRLLPTGQSSEQRGARSVPLGASSLRAARSLGRRFPVRLSTARRSLWASKASSSRPGRGRGKPGGADFCISSPRCLNIASPPIPSESAWWNTTTKAQVSSLSSLTRVADHKGRSCGRGSVTIRAAMSKSACSSPGVGQVTRWTWRSTSKFGSSTQTGRPQPNEVCTRRWRSRGTATIRSLMAARNWQR